MRKVENEIKTISDTLNCRHEHETHNGLGNKYRIVTSLLQKYRIKFAVKFNTAHLIASALFFAVMLFGTQGYAQQASCQKSDCSAATKGCIMAQDGNGHFKQLAANSDMNAACLHERSEKGCFDLTPVSCVGSYGGLGYRPNGAGGNNTPRNHYGSDLGGGACKRADGTYPLISVYAAADGVVSYVNTATGGGRTVAITHTKGCKNAAKGGQHYKSTYRHLLAYKVSVGQSVKKGDVIGLEGGSNAKCIGCEPCDATAQRTEEYKGLWTTAGCGKPYAVHMHFEIEDGAASSSGTQAHAATALDPSCNSLQTLCGGCPSAPGDKSCKGGMQGWADGTSGTAAGAMFPSGTPYTDKAVSHCVYGNYLDSESCVFCGLFKTMFNTASQISLMADKGLLAPTLSLVKIGFLIWLAVFLLKQFVSFNATNSGEMTKGILFQGFRVAVVALILSSSASLFYIMDLTLNPVMMTGLNFVQSLTPSSTEGSKQCDKNSDYMQGIKGYNSKDGYTSESITGGLSTEVGEAVVCNIKKMEDATSILMTLGRFSYCLSFENKWARIFPHLGYFGTGILLWLAGLALLMTFPWCLVDCILQLCIAAAMIPCAIGAYAFKVTSKYLKIIWDFFMNAMFNFVFMALVVYIISKQLESWLGIKLSDGTEPEHEIFIRPGGLAWYCMGFIRVASITFFCYVFFDEAKSMAEKFASSPSLGGGKGIGRMVGGTAMGAATQVGKGVAHVGVRSLKAAGSGVNWAVGNQYRSFRNHTIGYVASKLGKNTVGADGKKIKNEGSFRLFGRDIKFSAAQGEDGKWSLTREVHKRSRTDKAFEKVLDENGNEVKDEHGNTKYRARKRVFGFTTGYEELTAHQDEEGNTIYTSAETDKRGDPKFKFTMNDKGEINSYKTRFTRSYLGLGKAVEKENIKQYGVNRTVNTATSRTREKVDTHGNVTDSEIKMQDFNFFNRDLVRKDGTINIDTFNEMQKSLGDPERAAQALIAQVMKKRGLSLDNKYASRTVKIDDNGVVTIKQIQKDEDGNIINTQNIQAVMIGDQMFIANENIDSKGNITLNESNGIFHTVQTATKGKNGKYTYNFDGGFSDYVMSKNSFQAPLNFKGQWGNNIDRDKAMAGFSQTHYDKYMAKLQLKQMKRTMATGDYLGSERAGDLHAMLHAENIEKTEDALQNMTYKIEADRRSLSDRDKGDFDDKTLPDDLKNDVDNKTREIQEIRQEIDLENSRRERLEKEQKELKEKEDKSDAEEERIKRELEEARKKVEELKKKQEDIDRLVAEIRANEFDVNRYAFLAGEHENTAYRQHQKLDADGRVIVEVNDFGNGQIERHEYKYDSNGNRIPETTA